jgi:hypothetical protein
MPRAHPSATDPLVRSLLTGQADAVLRVYGAKGLLPVAPDDRLRIFLAVWHDPDEEIGRFAKRSAEAVAADDWVRLFESAELSPGELDTIARATDDGAVLARVIREPGTPDDTLKRLAASSDETVQEALSINQSRLLRRPELIDCLEANPALSADCRRRIRELREEFFEKADRRGRAAGEPAAPPAPAGAPEEPAPAPEAEAAADRQEARAEPTVRDLKEVHRRLAYMTTFQRIETALKGTREERRILLRDVNKQVREAVLACPTLNDVDVQGFASTPSLEDDVYRRIAAVPAWVRKYPTMLALVSNPSVPSDVAIPLVRSLRVRDLRRVMNDRNLSNGVRVMARKFYTIKSR